MHPIHWHNLDRDGHRTRSSETHAVVTERAKITVCGRRIPTEGDGVELEGGLSPEDWCERCLYYMLQHEAAGWRA